MKMCVTKKIGKRLRPKDKERWKQCTHVSLFAEAYVGISGRGRNFSDELSVSTVELNRILICRAIIHIFHAQMICQITWIAVQNEMCNTTQFYFRHRELCAMRAQNSISMLSNSFSNTCCRTNTHRTIWIARWKYKNKKKYENKIWNTWNTVGFAWEMYNNLFHGHPICVAVVVVYARCTGRTPTPTHCTKSPWPSSTFRDEIFSVSSLFRTLCSCFELRILNLDQQL